MTTSAVNENRRPPLTTLATRLISTTRSFSSRLSRSSRRMTSRSTELIGSDAPSCVAAQPARGRERAALHVVDELRRDALVRARHDEPRPLGRALHLAPNAAVTALAR